ncbi:RNA-dependent RNA polymerase [Fusarium circinatum mitovirus 2-1]|uniref:RNA-dependent RNA polymerase n=3 Tax=Mitoviridae TaxID=2732892 RepID=A0ABM5PU87_9VIRU|nr:RNA-dependent RNA polymerase [Fusarium circinatum mitovirus 2-1]AHI43534.1 RNA-dependent RNA polymerase [Fusarium circinatum mitovirus 2-1]
MLRNYIKIIKRLSFIFFPNKYHKDDFNKMLKLYQHLIKHHNMSGAIKYMKNMRLICTRYICGNPLLSNNFGIATTNGWPNKLSFLKSRIDTNEGLSYVLTLLIFNRSLDLNKYEVKKKMKNLDYSSITSKQRMNYTIPTGFIKEFVKKNNLYISKDKMDFTMSDIYVSQKGGPQGKASNSALTNFNNYNYYSLQRLFNVLSQSGIDFICKSYSYFVENSSKFKPKHNDLGKIEVIRDPEGKFRLIAIVDYYTQLALKKLHDQCFKVIRNLKETDRTFNQSPHHNWESNQHKFWSLDLSSATDRFPRKLQARLLSEMIDMHYAWSWNRILETISFHTKEGNSIKYEVGQPMGTYSSWICFTLAHHLVVNYAAKLAGYDNFNQYIILGDDIVIKNDKVAYYYIRIINRLGVDISLTKTHVSSDTYEFAKRWIKSGREITGIPVRGIIHNFKNINIVFTILYSHFKINGNTYLSNNSLVESLRRLYKDFYLIKGKKKYFPIRNMKSYINRLQTFSSILDVTFGYSNDQSIRQIFTRNITSDYYMIPSALEDSLLEIKKILSTGLGKLLSSNVGKVSSWQTKIIENYDDENRNNLIYYPTFVGLYNYINNIKTRTKRWSGSEEISELTQDLNVIDVDKVFSKERSKYDRLLTIGKSLEVGFTNINKTDEIYYGSATVESSLTPKGMQLWFSKSITKDVMDQIIEGKWEPPKPQMSYTDMWESLAGGKV